MFQFPHVYWGEQCFFLCLQPSHGIIHWSAAASNPLPADRNQPPHYRLDSAGKPWQSRGSHLTRTRPPRRPSTCPPIAPAHPDDIGPPAEYNAGLKHSFFKQISGNSWTDPWSMLRLCILHQWHVLSKSLLCPRLCVFVGRNWSELQFVHLLLRLFAPVNCTTDYCS